MFFALSDATGSGGYSHLFLVLTSICRAHITQVSRAFNDQNNLSDEDIPIYRARFRSPSHAEAPSTRRRTQLLVNLRPLIG